MTATSNFLSLPEMVEAVLLCPAIAVCQLLSLQRTSKQFQAIIHASPLLQRKLFVRQQSLKPGLDPNDFAHTHFQPNDLLIPQNPSWDVFGDTTFSPPSQPKRVYALHWASVWTDRSQKHSVLWVDEQEYESGFRGMKVPEAYLDQYLTDFRVGIVAWVLLGYKDLTRLWIPAGKATLRRVLEAVEDLRKGDLVVGAAPDGDGIYAHSDVGGEFYESEDAFRRWRGFSRV